RDGLAPVPAPEVLAARRQAPSAAIAAAPNARPPSRPFMKPFVRETLLRQRARLHELDALLSAPDVIDDLQRFRTLSREHADATALVEAFNRFEQREADLAAAEQMLDDPDMAGLAQEE